MERVLRVMIVAGALAGLAAVAPPRGYPVALADLVPPSDPLAAQDLRFDARFAELALEQLDQPDPQRLEQLAALPATAHLLRHARHFDYDVPKDTPLALVRDLVKPGETPTTNQAACRRSVAYFADTMLADPHWVGDVLADLPAAFHFTGATLFLTYGYDIGVAIAPTASLNGAHRRFETHPRELLYYAIHELHHVGFMTYQPPQRLQDLKTCAAVLRFVEYSTQLEGMAVHAAGVRRAREHALGDDADYVALGDDAVMRAAEARYDAIYAALRRRGDQPVDADAMAAIHQMSSERLWYRVGARMATRIDERFGRVTLTSLIKRGPADFFACYRQLGAERLSGPVAWPPIRPSAR